MEIKQEVKTYEVDYECDECETGKLRPLGSVLPTDPPQYPHQCTGCDNKKTFTDKLYPYTVYEY